MLTSEISDPEIPWAMLPKRPDSSRTSFISGRSFSITAADNPQFWLKTAENTQLTYLAIHSILKTIASRSAIWNRVNTHEQPAHLTNNFTCCLPFIIGTKPTDDQIARAVADIYLETGILVTMCRADDFLQKADGTIVYLGHRALDTNHKETAFVPKTPRPDERSFVADNKAYWEFVKELNSGLPSSIIGGLEFTPSKLGYPKTERVIQNLCCLAACVTNHHGLRLNFFSRSSAFYQKVIEISTIRDRFQQFDHFKTQTQRLMMPAPISEESITSCVQPVENIPLDAPLSPPATEKSVFMCFLTPCEKNEFESLSLEGIAAIAIDKREATLWSFTRLWRPSYTRAAKVMLRLGWLEQTSSDGDALQVAPNSGLHLYLQRNVGSLCCYHPSFGDLRRPPLIFNIRAE